MSYLAIASIATSEHSLHCSLLRRRGKQLKIAAADRCRSYQRCSRGVCFLHVVRRRGVRWGTYGMATSPGTTRVRARGCVWCGFGSRALGAARSAVEKRRPAGALCSRIERATTAQWHGHRTGSPGKIGPRPCASGLFEQYRPGRHHQPGSLGLVVNKKPISQLRGPVTFRPRVAPGPQPAGKNPTRLGAPLPGLAAAGDGGHRGRAGSGRPLWRRSASGAPAPASRRRGEAQATVVQGRAGAASARGPDPRHAGNAITFGPLRDAPPVLV